jgi:hypothetical protein
LYASSVEDDARPFAPFTSSPFAFLLLLATLELFSSFTTIFLRLADDIVVDDPGMMSLLLK